MGIRRLEHQREEKYWEAWKAPDLVQAILALLDQPDPPQEDAAPSPERAGSCQRVTGLVVNGAGESAAPARVPRDVIRRLKAAIFNREKGRPAKGEETLAQLKGMAAFVHMTDEKRGRAFLNRIAALEAKAASG